MSNFEIIVLIAQVDEQRERAERAEARVAELEHSLSDAMEQIEAIQGTSQVHIDRVVELERRESYQERCEDELQWWRQTHTDEEPPEGIWDEGQSGETAGLKARVAVLEAKNKYLLDTSVSSLADAYDKGRRSYEDEDDRTSEHE